mmetsp:Transcript_96499/g.229771  ORF Transcript_96499/g.229771 Transcript_96499/m.229771 type:complete len:217 (-) Transcript_96499:207-857(-)
MAGQVLLHLLHALIHGPVIPEVSPVADEEVQGLKGSVDLLSAQRLAFSLHFTSGLVELRLREAHEVGQVLHLVLLYLHVDVVNLLGRQHCGQSKHCCRLLLGHVTVPGALCVHQKDCNLLAIQLSQERLGPDPYAFCAGVHAALKPKALVIFGGSLYVGARCRDPCGQWKILVSTPCRLRLASRCSSLLGMVRLPLQEAEEEVQQEGLSCSESAHD